MDENKELTFRPTLLPYPPLVGLSAKVNYWRSLAALFGLLIWAPRFLWHFIFRDLVIGVAEVVLETVCGVFLAVFFTARALAIIAIGRVEGAEPVTGEK